MKVEFDFTGVPQAEILSLSKEFIEKIKYISSGNRDRDVAKKNLEENLLKWARNFGNELTADFVYKCGGTDWRIRHKDTTYSDFEYGCSRFTIKIPFTQKSQDFSSEQDFKAVICNHENVFISYAFTAKEAISLLNKYWENNKISFRVIEV